MELGTLFNFAILLFCGLIFAKIIRYFKLPDVAGYFLRPNGGFFPGFTLNEFLLGFLYGCWLYKKPVSLWRTFCACLSAVLVINLVLTPLWLNIMYGNAFVISGMRLIKNAVKLPLDTALLYFLLKAVETHRKKAL